MRPEKTDVFSGHTAYRQACGAPRQPVAQPERVAGLARNEPAEREPDKPEAFLEELAER